jgi:hypothetical protein
VAIAVKIAPLASLIAFLLKDGGRVSIQPARAVDRIQAEARTSPMQADDG